LELHKHAIVRMKLMAPSLDNSFRRRVRSEDEESQFNSLLEIVQVINLVPYEGRSSGYIRKNEVFNPHFVAKRGIVKFNLRGLRYSRLEKTSQSIEHIFIRFRAELNALTDLVKLFVKESILAAGVVGLGVIVRVCDDLHAPDLFQDKYIHGFV
nr:ARM repeat superfamily protein [Tanacetum cinerariifolium]